MIHLAIALGGLAGAFGRYGLGEWIGSPAGPGFPWATFAINLSGSILLGALMRVLPEITVPAAARAGLTVGLCGGFTTFSTFSFETVSLLQRDAWAAAALYVGGSALGGVVAVVTGMSAGALLVQRRQAGARFSAPGPESIPLLGRCGEATDRSDDGAG